jgi:dynein heavy chain
MMIESREDMLEKEKVKFLEAMKVSQQEFKENMEQLDKTIKSFSQYTNIDKHVEVAK